MRDAQNGESVLDAGFADVCGIEGPAVPLAQVLVRGYTPVASAWRTTHVWAEAPDPSRAG